MTLFFFELFSCGVLRFEEVPPSRALHGNLAIVFFAITWVFTFQLLRRLPSRFSAS